MALVPSAVPARRNADVDYPFRQHSDFQYLTGLSEPGCLALIGGAHDEHRFVLFVPPRDEKREKWDGPMLGIEGAIEDGGADAAYAVEDLEKWLPKYLDHAQAVHYRLGEQLELDGKVHKALASLRAHSRKGQVAPRAIVDISAILHELRLIKGEDEVAAITRAAAISVEAQLAAMKTARAGRFEYEVEGALIGVFARHGASEAYDSIVASGPNATVLHYRGNQRKLVAGELMLIDAGAELHGYASDITRTFPIGGSFSNSQRVLYEGVLQAEYAAIETVRPGTTIAEVHAAAARVISHTLVDHGLLEGPVERVMEEGLFRKFFLHQTSHWMGMDVHDVGSYADVEGPRKLAPGMVLTVEPGIYIPQDADVDPRWRGIGIRIEDDLVVTESGNRNLTADAPKEPAELEALLR